MSLGLDVGTGNLVVARNNPQDGNTGVKIDSIRDVFLDVEFDQSTLNMLKMSNISYVTENDSIYVIGDPALNIANLLKREARRPLSKGVISAGELEAEKMLMILLKSILKEPQVDDEMVYYSIPGNPINSDMDVLYHKEMFRKMVESFGFKATAMNEAAAVAYSNCANDGFTALTISLGAGMVNVALLFQTMVGMSFSIQNSGDWIDSSAAKAVGSTATRIMAIKEKGVNLLDPTDGDPKQLREREAIVVYYRNLINIVIDSIKKEFKKDSGSIELPDSIPWVISGGTALAKNFLPFFQKEFDKVRDTFPINISEIRMANNPLDDVAKGLLIAAMND
jgi:actin-like ATPase involved in cell morphogenesis